MIRKIAIFCILQLAQLPGLFAGWLQVSGITGQSSEYIFDGICLRCFSVLFLFVSNLNTNRKCTKRHYRNISANSLVVLPSHNWEERGFRQLLINWINASFMLTPRIIEWNSSLQALLWILMCSVVSYNFHHLSSSCIWLLLHHYVLMVS